MDIVSTITNILKYQSKAINQLANEFSPLIIVNIINEILNLKGRLILSGIGKSGYIAKKISSSFSSTGTTSLYIHPAEAAHGDLGMITKEDIVMLLSNSGETSELFNIINYCKRFHIKIITMTMNINSSLAASSNYVIAIPQIPEASSIDAPTTSCLLMLALSDAILTTVHELRGFTKEHFKLLHPGGKIGTKLLKVSELMHTGEKLPIVFGDTLMSDTIIIMTQKRFGCAIVVDKPNNQLIGIITDGDLRRHMSHNFTTLMAKDILTSNPITISPNMFAAEALALMNKNCVTTILIVKVNIVIGIIHLHDLLKVGVT